MAQKHYSACLERCHTGNLILSILIIQFEMNDNSYYLRCKYIPYRIPTKCDGGWSPGSPGICGKEKKSLAPPGNSSDHLVHRLRKNWSDLTSSFPTCALDCHLLGVAIPDAVLIQLDLTRMSKILLETCRGL